MINNIRFFVKTTEFILISVKILLFSTSLGAQSLSDLPMVHTPGTEWSKISSEHFDIIYPAPLMGLGQYTAETCEYFYTPLRSDLLPLRNYRFPVILSTEGTVSNGMVKPFPRSSLWFSGPDADSSGIMNSIAHLAVHEGRHIVQFDYMNRSTTHLLSILFGEAGLMYSWACLPSWVYEGDAVYAETSLTMGGRGRSSAFRSQFRSMVLMEQDFNFYKMSLGSYRHNIPNYYVYGYHVIRYLKDVYGESASAELLDTVAAVPLPAIGIYSGIRRLTGKGLWALHNDMTEYYRQQWLPLYENSDYTNGEILSSPLKSQYVYFSAPFFLDENSFLVRSGSLDHVPGLYLYENGEKTKKIGSLPSMNRMDIKGNLMVWDGLTQTLNYEMVSYSDIYLKNLDTGVTRKLTRKGRYYDPALSPDGQTIAAVYIDTAWESSLVFLDSGTGDIIQSIPFTGGQTLGWPSWDQSGESVVVLSREATGRGLLRFSLVEKSFERVLDPVRENIRKPLVYADGILFISDVSGVDAVYRLDNQGERSLAVLRPFGIDQISVSPDGETMIIVDQRGLGGEALMSIPLDEITERPWTESEEFSSDWDLPDFTTADYTFVSDETRSEKYTPGKFIPGQGSKIHSWGFLTDTDDLRLTKIPLGMIASDPMGTLIQKYWLTWDIFDYTPGFSFRLESRALPVKIQAGGDYFLKFQYPDYRNEITGLLDFSVPLGFSRRSIIYQMTPYVTVEAESSFVDSNDSSIRFPFTYGLSGGIYTWGSIKSILPRWGFTSQVRFSHTPFQEGYRQFSTSFRGFFPGLFRNQGLELDASYEWNPEGEQSYDPPPRGYSEMPYMEHRVGFSALYALPIAYPDLPLLGSFMYIKRIRANGFYEINIDPGSGEYFHSTGAELLFDMNLALIDLMDIDMGLRCTFHINEKSLVFQFLILGMSF